MKLSVPQKALNLELGDFGTCALGLHDAERHFNCGSASPKMSIGEFKLWALEIARNHLNLSK